MHGWQERVRREEEKGLENSPSFCKCLTRTTNCTAGAVGIPKGHCPFGGGAGGSAPCGGMDNASNDDCWVYRCSDRGQTVNTGTADIAVFNSANLVDGVYGVWGMAVGDRDNAGTVEGVSILVHACAKVDGGTLSIVGSAEVNKQADTNINGATAAIVANGTNLVLRVTGVDSTTIDWHGNIRFGFVRD